MESSNHTNDQLGQMLREKVSKVDSSESKDVNAIKDDSQLNTETKKKSFYSEDGVIDNWIHKLLWDTVYGRLANLILLITFSYIAWFTPGAFDVLYEQMLKPSILLPALAIELAMHLVILLFVYPLSRISSSTCCCWLVGTIGITMVMAIGAVDIMGTYFSVFIRMELIIEAMRISMKILAFLYECNHSKETFEKSTFWTLLYFLFAPTLIYKVDYGKAKRIRPLRLIHHFWWLCIISPLIPRAVYHLFNSILVVDMRTVTANELVTVSIIFLFGFSLMFYVCSSFGFYEIFNGFWGEILRFPNRRHFGEIKELFQPRKIPRIINITVSDFILQYLYSPIYKKTKSRIFALSVTFSLSVIGHEILQAYSLTQIIAPGLLCGLIIGPALSKRNLPLWLEIFRYYIVSIVPFYFLVVVLEYFVWNTSTIPIENESKLRLIPLCFPYITRTLFGQNVASFIYGMEFPPDA